MKAYDITIAGNRIAVRQSTGAGPAIVLLHGNSVGANSFSKQFSGPLARTHRVITFDFPGHGDSFRASDPDSAYSLPSLCRTLVETARAVDAADAVFVGWSLGGHVLLDSHDQLPDAAGFVIYGAPPLGSPPAMDRAFLPHPAIAELFLEELTDEQVRRRIDACLRPGAECPRELFDEVRRTHPKFRPALLKSLGAGELKDEVQIVRSLTRPLCVIHGAQDQVVNGEYIRSLDMPTLWRGAVQSVAGAGHSVHWEAPAEFNALVSDFTLEVSR